MKVVAIVQARLGSRRLPGKVLLDINGKPMLWHVMRRVMDAKLLDETILATADNAENKPIIEFARKYGFKHYAGSEIDLLDRFYRPCKAHNATIVVRICADCPLVDPDLIDKTVRYFIDNDDIDYVNSNFPHKLPHGLDIEVFSMKNLEYLWKNVQGKFEREWFVINFRDNPETWHLGDMDLEEQGKELRWTVDYPEDFELISKIFEQLDNEVTVFGMYDIFALLEARPALKIINDKLNVMTVEKGIEEARKQAKDTA